MARTATILSLFVISGPGALVQAQPVGGLDAPLLIEPVEGETVVVDPPTFSWQAVAGAEQYRLEWAEQPVFGDFDPNQLTDETRVTPSDSWFYCQLEGDTTVYWRVRAEAGGIAGPYSEVSAFHYVYFDRDWAGDGAGIVEINHPNMDPCANPLDPGCAEYGGNTVWHDPNVDADYYVSTLFGGHIDRLDRFIDAAAPDDFEIRFTEAGGYGAYYFNNGQIARVPFELWNVGDAEDSDDDIRMIPFLFTFDADSLQVDWTNQFTGRDSWPDSPCTGGCPITDGVYFMMPDRENGYELFEQAANAFGGAGAIYDPATDGDTQIDISPLYGTPCSWQDYYADFCYRDDLAARCFFGGQVPYLTYLIGHLLFADLAGDGTTPPPGTVVRLVTTDSPLDAGSSPPDPEEELPDAYTLLPVYPNPFSARAVVPFEVPEPSRVRIAAYDILGREVIVLADGQMPAGRHEVVLSDGGLSSGVYLIQLQAGGAVRAVRKVLLSR